MKNNVSSQILLDTQAFLWILIDSPLLSKVAKEVFLNPKVKLYFSIVSIWEIAIKSSLGKLELHTNLETLIQTGLKDTSAQLLSIDLEHVYYVRNLPFHHRDPFDRLLISQAICEKLSVLSIDQQWDKYSIDRIW